MKQLGLACRTFLRILRDGAYAKRIQALPEDEPRPEPEPIQSARNDALTLLSVLQQEARLVDFLQEPISAYSDAQIGAAVRNIHRDAGASIKRIFDLEPMLDQADGSSVTVPADYRPGRYKLTGNLGNQPPYQGKLCHHGWLARKCELPSWQGDREDAQVVAPIEVQLG
jgi:hypothetical protein